MTMKTLFKDLAITSIGVGALTFIALSPVLVHATEMQATSSTAFEQSDETRQAITAGFFKGKSRHKTSGDVEILKTSTGYELVLSDNFSLDGAPTPVLGFGNNGRYDKESTFAKLNKIEGRQSYILPEGFAPSTYNEVYVWCEKFSIPLGVANLKAT